jgi:hypothetical protein
LIVIVLLDHPLKSELECKYLAHVPLGFRTHINIQGPLDAVPSTAVNTRIGVVVPVHIE